jgi:hypothetical protein
MKHFFTIILILFSFEISFSHIEIKPEIGYQYSKGVANNIQLSICSCVDFGDTLKIFSSSFVIYNEPYELCQRVFINNLMPDKYFVESGTYSDSIIIPPTQVIYIKKEN